MIEKDIKEIIPQLPGESDSSYCRLILMLTQGLPTLQELHDHLKKEDHRYYVTIDTLKHCSANDHWTERRNKYLEIREMELREEVEELFQKLNVTGIHDMEVFLEELNTFKEDIIQRYKKGEYKASYALKCVKDYIFCYRQATEIYYINSRHKLEPDNEKEDTITPDEEIINIDLLCDDAMQERTTLLHNLMKGEQ